MSMRDKVIVQCPKCRNNIEVEQWSAINGDKNPQQKKKILDGTLFNIKCEKCGKLSAVGYPLLYNDTKSNVMIWLVFDDDEVKHVQDYYKTSKTTVSEDSEDVDENCRQRIVRDSFRLREKIMIFDSGLDDKIVEIAKLAYSKSAQMKCRNDKIAAAFFTNDNGENKVEMYTEGGKAFVSKLSSEVYKDLCHKYGEKAAYAEDRVYVIDDVWALNFLRSIR